MSPVQPGAGRFHSPLLDCTASSPWAAEGSCSLWTAVKEETYDTDTAGSEGIAGSTLFWPLHPRMALHVDAQVLH